jgi:hypothetical protein
MGFVQEFPGNMTSNDTLRLMIVANSIERQDLQPKNNPGHVEVGGVLYSWNLVAPSDIQENIQHDWEEYGSWQGRMAELKTNLQRGVAAGASALGGAVTRGNANTNLALAKVDSPMVYTGSKRLEYSITIPFMRYKNGAYKDVFEPIHQLRKLSCASMGNGDTIGFPAIFEIYTMPANFLDIKFAALKDVQTKYESPFVGGYPQRAECTLTFMDIQPLYQESWRNGKELVTVEAYGGTGR